MENPHVPVTLYMYVYWYYATKGVYPDGGFIDFSVLRYSPKSVSKKEEEDYEKNLEKYAVCKCGGRYHNYNLLLSRKMICRGGYHFFNLLIFGKLFPFFWKTVYDLPWSISFFLSHFLKTFLP